MPEATPSDRPRWSRWTDRLKIIALGLTLGLVARWINQAWQATQQPERPRNAVVAPKGPVAPEGPKAEK